MIFSGSALASQNVGRCCRGVGAAETPLAAALHHLVLKVWLQDQKPPRNILFLYCNKAAVCAYACVCVHMYVCVCMCLCV